MAKPNDIDDTQDDGAAAKPAKRKFPLKLIIIGVAALAIVIGGGTGAWMVFGGQKQDVAAAKIKPAVFYDVPDVLVNLANTGSERSQYLKVKIVLELPDQTMVAAVQPVMPRVVDSFQTYLRELRPTDLEGSAGLYRLREEMARRVNAAIAPGRVNAVLFKEIVVQ